MGSFSFLFEGPEDAKCTFILAHGAGAPMDSLFMDVWAKGLGEAGLRVVRFEFEYMAQRRTGGKKRPPSRMPQLIQEWMQILDAVPRTDYVLIGGKSMGGRVASHIADSVQADGLVCLGYPFHPSGKPTTLRTAHLETLRTPTLIVQGTRDPMGTKEEVEEYTLSESIQMHWLEDGEHSFKPRKTSGFTQDEHWRTGIESVCTFASERGWL